MCFFIKIKFFEYYFINLYFIQFFLLFGRKKKDTYKYMYIYALSFHRIELRFKKQTENNYNTKKIKLLNMYII
jgi:hypothetical protein